MLFLLVGNLVSKYEDLDLIFIIKGRKKCFGGFYIRDKCIVFFNRLNMVIFFLIRCYVIIFLVKN